MKTRKATPEECIAFEDLKNKSVNRAEADRLCEKHFRWNRHTPWDSDEAFRKWDKAVKAWQEEYTAAGFEIGRTNLRIILPK